ncbi:DUF2156 domain-containing protein [Microbacterium sp. STN6]|uniref:bifunctional lysylphosphatidylglycerol flippase/synthetase MprF n=1 Tax=Microbacterium sp. STN6 TaxID=2995588 RepID=UPI0022609BED|nr:DUF2156 domain-containing protein [Microbacterium sp. STN6]MCX7522910.1 DUF2156 domain-containing protein [Microbacterium sp. STN6]
MIVIKTLRARPFTFALAAVIAVLALVTGPLHGPRPGIRFMVGTGYEPVVEQGHWWTLLVSSFFSQNLLELVVALVLVVVLVGVAENLMGTWRTALAFALTTVGGTLVGIAVQAIALGVGELWSRDVVELVTLDPFTGIAGVIMAASGSASALWRRRIRWLTMLATLVLLLYSGQPSDLYRLMAAVLGLALGALLSVGKHIEVWRRSSHHEVRVLMASMLAITAIGPAIVLYTGTRFGPLAPIAMLLGNDVPDPGQTLARCQVLDVTRHCLRELTLERISSPGPVIVSILPLLVLLLVAYGLLRGRRFALGLAVAINAFFAVIGAYYFGLLPIAGTRYVPRFRGHVSWEAAFALLVSVLLPAAIAIALLVLRRNFPIRASRASVTRYIWVVAVSAIVLALLYLGVGALMAHTGFSRPVGFGELVNDVAERFIPVSFLHHKAIAFLPTQPATMLVYHGVGPAFWLIVLLAAVRPTLGNLRREQTGNEAHVRDLLEEGGGDSFSFMATWPGNSYWFDPVQRFAIAYRVVGRVAITTGGPFGCREAKGGAIRRFARYCDDQGWLPVFYSVDGGLTPVFSAMGWSTMTVAEETVIHPQDWRTTGKKWQDVRTAINRAQRAGITAVWTDWDSLPVTIAAQVTEISEQWVAERGLPEMGFTLGSVDELRDPAVRLMLAIDESERVEAVTSWLPSYQRGEVVGWTLDFMRRRPGGANGVMEFLIAEAATRMRDDDIDVMSLSAAPLAHTVVDQAARSRIDRLLGFISTSLEPVYGFRSLLAFKRKFQPELHELIMAYPDPTTLPEIGLALTRAYLPDLTMRRVAQLILT